MEMSFCDLISGMEQSVRKFHETKLYLEEDMIKYVCSSRIEGFNCKQLKNFKNYLKEEYATEFQEVVEKHLMDYENEEMIYESQMRNYYEALCLRTLFVIIKKHSGLFNEKEK